MSFALQPLASSVTWGAWSSAIQFHSMLLALCVAIDIQRTFQTSLSFEPEGGKQLNLLIISSALVEVSSDVHQLLLARVRAFKHSEKFHTKIDTSWSSDLARDDQPLPKTEAFVSTHIINLSPILHVTSSPTARIPFQPIKASPPI